MIQLPIGPDPDKAVAMLLLAAPAAAAALFLALLLHFTYPMIFAVLIRIAAATMGKNSICNLSNPTINNSTQQIGETKEGHRKRERV